MEAQDWTPEGVRVLDRTNGSAASHQERPNPLRRIEWVPLGDEYPGLEVKVWVNPPRALVAPVNDLIKSDPEAGVLAFLKLLVLDHRDADGQPWQSTAEPGPLPSPSLDAFWDAIPGEVTGVITARLMEAQKKVKASVEGIFDGSTEASSDETRPSKADLSGSAGTTSGATLPSAGTATPEP